MSNGLSNGQVILILVLATSFTVVMLFILHFQNKRAMTPEKAQAQAQEIAANSWKIYEIKLSDYGVTITIRLVDNPFQRYEELLFTMSHPDTFRLQGKSALDPIVLQYSSAPFSGGHTERCTSYLRII